MRTAGLPVPEGTYASLGPLWACSNPSLQLRSVSGEAVMHFFSQHNDLGSLI